jgi:transcriptional regulator GlxA family with amidase domain
MLAHNYMFLRLNRLTKPNEWASKGDGLAFIFPNSGSGKYTSGSVTHRFGPGDVLVLGGTAEGKLGIADGTELVFWCFSAHLEHLFPLFAEGEISLVQDLEDRFKPARLYSASTSVTAECHKLVASVPTQFNLAHRSHVLNIAAAVLSVELANARPQNPGFGRFDEHLNSVFKSLNVEEILDLSIGDLASRFNCGRRHLTGSFTSILGVRSRR